MTTTQGKIGKMIHELMQERDELRVRLHLGKEDLKDEWEDLHDKLNPKSRG